MCQIDIKILNQGCKEGNVICALDPRLVYTVYCIGSLGFCVVFEIFKETQVWV